MVTTSCAVHPETETALSCTLCDRPACPDCLTTAAVGQHCVGCTRGRPAAGEKGLAAFKLRSAVVGVDEHAKMRRPGAAFYGLVAVFLVCCLAAFLVPGTIFDPETFDVTRPSLAAKVSALSVVLSGAVLGLAFHEWAHAIVAFWGGDRTVAEKGYLTLDVRDYSNPLLSIGMPMAFLLLGGLPLPGGAVWINHHHLRSKWWDSAVSLAGPAINFLGAMAIYAFVATGILGDHEVLESALMFLAYIEIGIVILNLLPVPGLDGYGVIEPHLPQDLRTMLAPIKQYSMIILVLVVINGALLQFIWDWNEAFADALPIESNLIAWGEDLADPSIFGRNDD